MRRDSRRVGSRVLTSPPYNRLPDIKTKRYIFKIHTSRMSLADDVDLEEFVQAKDELSGADIKAVCTEAGLLALRERRMRVTMADLRSAREKTMFAKKDNGPEGLCEWDTFSPPPPPHPPLPCLGPQADPHTFCPYRPLSICLYMRARLVRTCECKNAIDPNVLRPESISTRSRQHWHCAVSLQLSGGAAAIKRARGPGSHDRKERIGRERTHLLFDVEPNTGHLKSRTKLQRHVPKRNLAELEIEASPASGEPPQRAIGSEDLVLRLVPDRQFRLFQGCLPAALLRPLSWLSDRPCGSPSQPQQLVPRPSSTAILRYKSAVSPALSRSMSTTLPVLASTPARDEQRLHAHAARARPRKLRRRNAPTCPPRGRYRLAEVGKLPNRIVHPGALIEKDLIARADNPPDVEKEAGAIDPYNGVTAGVVSPGQKERHRVELDLLSIFQVRGMHRVKLCDVTMDDVLDGKHTPPLTLRDFEDFLCFRQKAAENLCVLLNLPRLHKASLTKSSLPKLFLSLARRIRKVLQFASERPAASPRGHPCPYKVVQNGGRYVLFDSVAARAERSLRRAARDGRANPFGRRRCSLPAAERI